ALVGTQQALNEVVGGGGVRVHALILAGAVSTCHMVSPGFPRIPPRGKQADRHGARPRASLASARPILKITMPTLLVSPQVHHEFAHELRAAGGPDLRFAVADTDRPLSAQELSEVDIALMSLDVVGPSSRTVLSPLMQLFSDQLLAAP
ncbi:hypothetical protein ACQV5M_21860, partial [Leptospira sp. SA-E8]|uniref:hypothetical protein n=1 Tax=Leptospira sp. SA-E8 TaxID=3422259 RepID=UPI003EC0496F